jgi:hypothetical protein
VTRPPRVLGEGAPLRQQPTQRFEALSHLRPPG